jgi:hypothetical protein
MRNTPKITSKYQPTSSACLARAADANQPTVSPENPRGDDPFHDP